MILHTLLNYCTVVASFVVMWGLLCLILCMYATMVSENLQIRRKNQKQCVYFATGSMGLAAVLVYFDSIGWL